MPAKLYHFNGQMMPMAKILQSVPALKRQSVRDHIKAGRVTSEAMLCHKQKLTKPSNRQQFSFGRRRPHAMGGPAPTAPVRVR